MGAPMARRLVGAGHSVVVFDVRASSVDALVDGGAQAATSARDVADRVDTVMVSVPSPQVSMDVAAAVAEGDRIRRFIDLSTVGHQAAQRNHSLLAQHGVAALDSPVSGGVHGAEAGTLAVMVSGPR